MKLYKWLNVLVVLGLITGFVLVKPAYGYPIDGPGSNSPRSGQTDLEVPMSPITHPASVKPIDIPNPLDHQRMMERQRLLEEGKTADANALIQEGTDRVLVVLVEFAGTDVVTWTVGDTWDPLGIADTSEDAGTAGDCSKIITETTKFTYSGPMHNQIPRPLSPTDRSGDSIWTPDFSPNWFNDFMFGEGVVFSYTMEDGTPVLEDFTGESVANYYKDFSNGVYTVTGDIIGWVPLNHSTFWYDADQCPGARSTVNYSPSRGVMPGGGTPRTLVKDALDQVNAMKEAGELPGFNWADYDLNHDGVIDRLWIVHAGYGEEDAVELLNRTDYGEGSVWSHSSAVTPCYKVDTVNDICAGPYIVMPENGGIGVFAHEYSHNLGSDDLYAYNYGETSAGFWTLMADDWTGHPIGFEPPSLDPWHLDNFGWLEPKIITDTSKVYEFTLGQPSEFPGGTDVFRGAKIELPDGVIAKPVPVWQGNYYWWGGAENVANGKMTTAGTIDLATAVNPSLTFSLTYDIENEWDFMWVQVSEDDGTTWETITNTNQICTHDPGWIGGEYGFPDNLCAEGIYGFSGDNTAWPDPEVETFDLSSFAGHNIKLRFWYMTDWATLWTGPYVDQVKVADGATVLFEDNAEAGDANWTYVAPWKRSDGTETFTHNFYLQWRNTNDNGGYDSALGDPRWRFGPANTGLLAWYNNNYYYDNEVYNHITDQYPGFGPKGRMLVVDSQPEPYRDPFYTPQFPNEGANVTSRMQMRDAPFTLQNTVDFTVKPPYIHDQTDFSGRMPEFTFHDALGYYPGLEYATRGPLQANNWITKQWDASATMPSTKFYGVKAPGYLGESMRFFCELADLVGEGDATHTLCYALTLGYDGGTGNPGEVNGQYGWHAQVIEEAADHTWAKVRVWNSPTAVDSWVNPDKSVVEPGGVVNYDVKFRNSGSKMNFMGCLPLDTAHFQYVSGSASADVSLLTSCPATGKSVQYAESPDAIGALAIFDASFEAGEEASFSFQVKVKGGNPNTIVLEPNAYDSLESLYTSVLSQPVDYYPQFMPFISK